MEDESLKIHNTLRLPLGAIRFAYSRSSGPGGQNVNKVNTKAELRFDLERCPHLTPRQKWRIASVLGRRVNKAGEIVVTCGRHRSREQNREECLSRFAELLRGALRRKKKRVPTRPTGASREKRLRAKRERSKKKRNRGRVIDD
ncbi:MAG: alternative ribosome rescue aminoacyl-tRNA hydrolase ArfB [Planctomycetota bacterium]